MHICLDIDDTITYAPDLFSLIVSACTEASITIISFRTDRVEAERTLRECGIAYHRLILSSDEALGKPRDQSLAEWKAEVVNNLSPDWFFEDMPEVVALISPDIKVFMPCDELIRGWLRTATSL